MAKKTRKVLKQETQQRAIQQAVANVNAAVASPQTPAAAPQPEVAAARASKYEVTAEQEFAYVKSDVRKSLTLAGVFIAVLMVLSFFIK